MTNLPSMCCGTDNTSLHRRLKHQPETTVRYLEEADTATAFRDPTTQQFYCKRCHTGNEDPVKFQSHTRSCLAIDDTPEISVACEDPYDLPDPQTFLVERPITPDIPVPEQFFADLRIDQLPRSNLGPQLASQMHRTPQEPTCIQELYQLDAPHGDRVDPEPIVLLPGPDTVVSHHTIPLQRMGLVINTQFHAIICLACQRQVLASHLHVHLWAHFGRYIPIPSSMMQHIYQHFPGLDIEDPPIFPQGTAAIPPIFGLRIHRNFHFCGSCGRGYRHESHVQNHILATESCRRAHGTEPKMYKGYAQSFMIGALRRFFRVESPRSQRGGKVDFQTLVARRPHLQPQEIPTSVLVNVWDLAQFLAGEGWDEHVRPFNRADLFQLVSAPSSDEPLLLNLEQHVLAYLGVGQKLVRRCRLSGLLETLADVGGGHVLGGFEAVSSTTLETHARVLVRLLCFVMRTFHGQASTYNGSLSFQERLSCAGLLVGLNSKPDDASTWVALIHSVTHSLFSQEFIHWADERVFFSPVNRALVLLSLHPDSGWHPASVVASTVASLMYCIRSTMLYHLHVLSRSKRMRAEEFVNEVRPFLIHGNETIMSYLIDLHKHLIVLRGNEQGQSLTRFADQNGQSLLYQGDLVRLGDIATMVTALVNRYRTLMDRDVFHGLQNHPSLHLEYDVSQLSDDLENQTPFFSFIDDLRNPFWRCKDNLLKLLLTDKRLAGRYHFVANGRVIWHTAASLNLFKTIQRARSLLLVVTHLTYGNPGCSADVLTQTIGNMPDSFMRSVVILAGRLCFLAADPGSGATNLIVRALPDFLAKLWIQYLVLIRPVEVEIAHALFLGGAFIRYRLYLCPMVNRELAPEDFSGVLGDLTQEYLGTRLTVQPWRQVQACFAQRHGLASQIKMELEDEQLSHTATRNYAVTQDMLNSLDVTRVRESLRSSCRWHAILGVAGRNDGLPAVGDARGTSDVVNPPSADDLRAIAADLQRVAATMGNSLDPEMHTLLSDVMDRLDKGTNDTSATQDSHRPCRM